MSYFRKTCICSPNTISLNILAKTVEQDTNEPVEYDDEASDQVKEKQSDVEDNDEFADEDDDIEVKNIVKEPCKCCFILWLNIGWHNS